jgi:polysaccharide biosynthesis/export protein
VPAPSPAGAGDYRIGPEDVLDIAVWNNTAVSRTVRNDVPAASLTPMQLRDALVTKLTDYMPTPEVSVIVREVHRFKVSVIAAAPKAGQYELKSRATVLDALALAGGFTQFAARARVVILRPNGGAVTRVAFNYNQVVGSEVPPEELVLRPGDVVVVP